MRPWARRIRALINRAASLLPSELRCFSLVLESGTTNLFAITYDTTEGAWSAAADIAAEVDVKYLDKPVKQVLSLVSER
jgi:hypothetical protein